jgi:ABC-type amino acid transport system permease subunit
MIRNKVRNVEIVVPTVLAVVLAIVLSIGAIYLTEIFLGPIEQVEAHQSVAGSGGITEAPNPDRRLSRVHLLLSGMK